MTFRFSSGGSGGEENVNKWVNEFIEDSDDVVYGAGNDGLYIYHPLNNTLANLDSMAPEEDMWLCLDSNENVHMVSRNGTVVSYNDDMRIEQTGDISSEIPNYERSYGIEATPSDNILIVGYDSNYDSFHALVDTSDLSIIWQESGSTVLRTGHTHLFMSVHNDGNIYQSSSNDDIITVDLDTGNITNTVGGGAQYSSMGAGPDSFVYAANWDNNTLEKMDPSDGSIEWSVNLNGQSSECVYTPFDQIWTIDRNRNIYAISPDGSIIDSFRLSDDLFRFSYPYDEEVVIGTYGAAGAAVWIATVDNGRIKSDISVSMEENNSTFNDDMMATPRYETYPELF